MLFWFCSVLLWLPHTLSCQLKETVEFEGSLPVERPLQRRTGSVRADISLFVERPILSVSFPVTNILLLLFNPMASVFLEYFACMYGHTLMCMPGAHRSQRVSEALALDLQMIVRYDTNVIN